jgi:spore photoproduct lyase
MKLKTVYIDDAVAKSREAISIAARINVPVEIVPNADEVFRRVSQSSDPAGAGKEILWLTRNKGPFLKDCPGTKTYICCDYEILHVGSYCNMDCAYCILQSYFHPPVLTYFVNHDDMGRQLKTRFAQNRIGRIGTGEFTDSMIWEKWCDLSSKLVPVFADQKKTVLELKTKTVNIDSLENLGHNRKTILAWSLNTEAVIDGQERRTTSLAARLKAAARCVSWGYPVAFHFDPLIIYPGCEEDYKQVLDSLFETIDPAQIVWISLGALRFMPELKNIIADRFPDSKIPYGEFITGLDNKMRYFKPLRIELFKMMVTRIKALAPEVLTYLCMEDGEAWQKVFGFVPEDQGGLGRMLDKSAILHCDLEN